jgi:hypothetical protein
MSESQNNDPREARARAKAGKAYRRAQRPWYKKKRYIAPLVLVVLFVVIGIAGGKGSKPGVSGEAASPSKRSGTSAFAGGTPDDVVARAGQSVNAEGLTVTTGPLKVGDSFGGASLCTAVNYSNGKNEPVDFNGGFDWKLQAPHGAAVMSTFAGSNQMPQAGKIAPGGQASGDVCFQMPNGSQSGQYVVLYDPSFRLSSNRIAWINQR